ncbi:MAG: UPF0175 family protein [Thermomicrobiales bacterium]
MVTVQIEDELAALMANAGERVERIAREMIVLELYRGHTISRGKAAELLGMTLLDFLQLASKHGIPYIDMTLEEWEAERELIESRWQD